MVTSHCICEYYVCPKRAYRFLHEGCVSVHMAVHVREQLRIMEAFSKTDHMQNATSARGKTLQEASLYSMSFLTGGSLHNFHQNEQNCENGVALSHAVLSTIDGLYAYVPLCTQNTSSKAWGLHFLSTSGAGLRHEQKIAIASALYACETNDISVQEVMIHTITAPDDEYILDTNLTFIWNCTDVTVKSNKHFYEIKDDLKKLIAFVNSEAAQDERKWTSCNRQYCDVCDNQHDYVIDDVRTLRKSKKTIDDLLAQNITCITDIPASVELHLSAQRQIDAVKTDKMIFYEDEIRTFTENLAYPRYYLDFEAFSTAVPVFPTVNPWAFVPFLFSLQWQDYARAPVYTNLWAMAGDTDKRLLMWNHLKKMTYRAGCIVVYSRSFEDEMIRQLAAFAGEKRIGEALIRKIVDLQTVFYYLAAYDPRQKGKISLKNLASVWLDGDYTTFSVQNGMEANYFFTSMVDQKHNAFSIIKERAYPSYLLKTLNYFDVQKSITLQDIAKYCKYDTEVMIRLVAILENLIEK